MAELPYSFHLGSNKNRKASARSNARNNVSGSSSLANNGIQNYQQLSKVNNHDFRKYENDNDYIYQLKGGLLIYEKQYVKKKYQLYFCPCLNFVLVFRSRCDGRYADNRRHGFGGFGKEAFQGYGTQGFLGRIVGFPELEKGFGRCGIQCLPLRHGEEKILRKERNQIIPKT